MKSLFRRVCYAAFLFFFLFVCCENPFSFSPYDAEVAEALAETTRKNLERIKQLAHEDQQSFKIALLADTHYHYDKLKKAIDVINAKTDIAFVIVAGDITENGLLKEYELFHKLMSKLNKPYLTVIGNHDYLSNGEKIYQKMFGPLNYSFVFMNVKFILFDNVFWESKKLPDFDWLINELADEHNYDHFIPVSHIPLFDQQFDDHRFYFHQLLVPKVKLSIHGHRHTFFLGDMIGDGQIEYLTIGSPQHNIYCELTVTRAGLTVEKIDF